MIQALLSHTPLAGAVITLALLAPPALAAGCNPPVVLVEPGAQAEYRVPEQDAGKTMETLFGASPEPGRILVVDTRGRSGHWVRPTDLRDALLGLGAETNGLLYSGPPDCRPTDPALPLTLLLDPLPDRQPIELFPDDPAKPGGVTPRSGLWQARLGATEIEGCPAMMRQAFAVSPGKLPPEALQPRRLSFTAPFHPDQLELTRTIRASWTADGPARWTAIMNQVPGQPGGGAAAFPGGTKLRWTLSVAGPERMEHLSAIEITLPKEAAALLGATGDCRVLTRATWERIGD
jgi:hypothetical protein